MLFLGMMINVVSVISGSWPCFVIQVWGNAATLCETHDCIKDITGTFVILPQIAFCSYLPFTQYLNSFWRQGCSTKDVMTSPHCMTFILKGLVTDSSFSSDKYSEGDLLCCSVSPRVVLKYNVIPSRSETVENLCWQMWISNQTCCTVLQQPPCCKNNWTGRRQW